MKKLRDMDLSKYQKEPYPDSQARQWVIDTLDEKGVTMEIIAKEALEGQKKFNPSLDMDIMLAGLNDVLQKREVVNALMVGLSIDKMATQGLLPEPLQSIMVSDKANMGVDETLAMSVVAIFGSVADMQLGSLDLHKHSIAKYLDELDDGSVNTMIDDLCSALISATEAKVMNALTVDEDV